ncbi:MAG: hypothetical protein MR902_08005, partial [Campylobacter sp.]|nr:hypothetical protein [Campylobacter sp.]
MPLALIISIGSAVVSGISYIAKTIIEWLKRKAEALPFYSATLVINTSMLALFSTYVYAIIKLITFTYGVINDFIAFLSNLGGSGEVTDLIQKMLSTAMFYQAL